MRTTPKEQARYAIAWIKQYVLCLSENREVRLLEPCQKTPNKNWPGIFIPHYIELPSLETQRMLQKALTTLPRCQ